MDHSETPQDTPQEQTWNRWMDGNIGNRLWELADLSTPDLVTDDDGNMADWPPFDVEVAVNEALQSVKARLGGL